MLLALFDRLTAAAVPLAETAGSTSQALHNPSSLELSLIGIGTIAVFMLARRRTRRASGQAPSQISPASVPSAEQFVADEPQRGAA